MTLYADHFSIIADFLVILAEVAVGNGDDTESLSTEEKDDCDVRQVPRRCGHLGESDQ